MARTGLKLIKEFEGCKLEAYLCPAKVWTIGWGYTHGVKRGDKMTQAQADSHLIEEYDRFEAQVRKLVKVPLTDNQLGSLVSFTYNLGAGNLSESTLLKKLNAKDYEGAAEEFGRWNKAAGKVLNGLTRRRKAEKDLFETK